MAERNEEALQPGMPAPDFSLVAHTGEKIQLSSYRGSTPVVLFFVREYGCMQCRSMVAQLGHHYGDFRAAGAEVFVFIGDPLERAQRYAQLMQTPFRVLADPDRDVYHRYGLYKAVFVIQRTAVVIIDKQGVIRYLKTTANATTWLQEAPRLLDALQQLYVAS